MLNGKLLQTATLEKGNGLSSEQKTELTNISLFERVDLNWGCSWVGLCNCPRFITAEPPLHVCICTYFSVFCVN